MHMLNLGGISGSVAYATAGKWAGARTMHASFDGYFPSSCLSCSRPSFAHPAMEQDLHFIRVDGATKRRLNDEEVKARAIEMWQKLPKVTTKPSMYQQHARGVRPEDIPTTIAYDERLLFFFRL